MYGNKPPPLPSPRSLCSLANAALLLPLPWQVMELALSKSVALTGRRPTVADFAVWPLACELTVWWGARLLHGS
jgi:hypothetical protein